MFKLNKNNESGRSMVEMLGVLAIVGVLSVSGIAGYTTAMNAHRANKAINRMMRLAVVVSGQKLLGQTASISGEDADDVTLTEDTANGKFTLKISGLSEPVRTKISNMDVATAELSTDAQGNLAFTFSNDLSERSSGTQTGENSGGSGQQQSTPEKSAKNCWHEGGCSYDERIAACAQEYPPENDNADYHPYSQCTLGTSVVPDESLETAMSVAGCIHNMNGIFSNMEACCACLVPNEEMDTESCGCIPENSVLF